MNIPIYFTVEEINNLLQILGQTPSSCGAYPFMVKIREQTEKAIQAPQPLAQTVPQQPTA